MKRKWSVRGATVAAIAVLGGMLFPAPAHAICHGWIGTDENSVGVGGEPVASTPEFHFQWCVEITGTPTNPTLPTPSVECISSVCPNLLGTWISIGPYDTGAVTKVTINYTLDGDFHTHSVSVPDLPTSGSGEQCVFFIGNAVNNPGGCLLFVNHGI